MNKNDIIRLDIIDMTSDGSGVGKADSMVIFVPDTAVGDVCDVRILKVKKNVCYGKVEKIIERSDDRVDPVCPVSSRCGGCVYRHMSYDAELRIKHKKVYDAVTRIGKVDGDKVKEIIGAYENQTNRYRNKAQIPVGLSKTGEVEMGFYSRHSHRIAPCDDCLLSPEIFTQISDTFKEFVTKYPYLIYSEEKHSGKIRHLYLRIGEKTGEVMVCVVVNGRSFDHQDELFNSIIEKYPEVKSIVINVNKAKTNVILGYENIVVFGKESITDVLCGLKFELSPLAFYQVNRTQAQRLYEKAKEYADLSGNEVLIDLYCGTGTIGLSMANSCKTLIGVEIIDEAIENAKKNAENNGISNARFICGDAEKAATELQKEGITPDVIIVDPPRKGLTEKLIHTIVEMNPKRVVYVSCDPATLGRDLKIFEELQYFAKEITPVDLFPRTAHCESVCLLSKE